MGLAHGPLGVMCDCNCQPMNSTDVCVMLNLFSAMNRAKKEIWKKVGVKREGEQKAADLN